MVVGSGEGGGRIADAFAKLGYRARAINTAQVDLDGLQAVPKANHLHIGIGPSGAGQDMALGREAMLAHENKVREFLTTMGNGVGHFLLTVGGRGGTGSGSLSELVLVDNERIGELFPGLTVANYWSTANHEIAEAWDVFDRLSTRPSLVFSAVDGMDYARLLSAGGYAVMGLSAVSGNDEQAIAQAMRADVHGGLLANEFDLATSRATAATVSGSKTAIERLPVDHLLTVFRTLQDRVSQSDDAQA